MAEICVFYDPERPVAQALGLLAGIASKRNNHDEARRLWARIIELYPQSNQALQATICLIEADVGLGRHDDARSCVISAIMTLEGMAKTADQNGLPNRATECRATATDLRNRFLSGKSVITIRPYPAWKLYER
jgi:hypothetical protein